MQISLIVAMDQNRGIGKDNGLPWHLPNDLKHFKQLTSGHHIIMGRKTFESIGRPLPNRTSIIVTRNQQYEAEGCLIVHSIGEAIALAQDSGEEEAFIIGGGELYKHSLPLAHRLYLTRVHAAVEGIDTQFPPISAHWKVIESENHEVDEKHAFSYTFETLKRL